MTTPAVLQSPKTRALPRAERDAKILALRAVGQPIQAIADRLGCGEKTVRRVVGRRLDELTVSIQLDTQRIRAQHLLELEALRVRLGPALAGADHGHRVSAVRAWLQVMEREARLLGLDQPMKLELAAQSQASQALLQHLAERLDPNTMEEVISALTES